jgi:hypothetical protein
MSGEETTALETSAPAKEFLANQDKHLLDMVKMRMSLALANAEKALAQNETVKVSYDNLILQLSFKYNLKEKDLITEQGEIVRGKAE